jgi:hypothetical protein
MADPRSLAAIQERFYALVTAAEGVAPALAAEPGAPPLAEMVKSDAGARLDAVARLDVYANMYFYRLLDVLREAYPRLTAAVGEVPFHNLITEYLVACRPRHPSIEFAGERLAGFLSGHPLGREQPWLVALARLERTYTELFDGPDAETLSLDEVRALSPEQLTTLPLTLIPCHRVLAHDFTVDPFCRALDAGDEGETPAQQPEVLLVWRQDREVFHRPLAAQEQTLLALAAAGTTIQQLCDAVTAESTEAAAQQVFQTVARWLGDSLVRAG